MHFGKVHSPMGPAMEPWEEDAVLAKDWYICLVMEELVFEVWLALKSGLSSLH